MIRSLSFKFAGATVLLLALLVSFITPVATAQASTPSTTTPSQHLSLSFTQFAQTTPPEATTCAVEKIGWIICPIFEGAARAADRAFVFLAEWFLEVPPELFNNESKTKDAWEQARNLANVAFVIAFLILIYSQITGGVMSNYGIKRMLPRLIIAAIAVNVSYYICQALVDISNLLGFNIKAALDTISKDLPQVFYQDPNQAGSTNTQTSNSGLSAITIGVLGAAGVWALLGIMGGSLGVAIGTIIFILIILMLRKALIILLIVVSPLAFVAYLLPNTENYFKQWLNMFWQLLLVFPIVALLLGGGQLAGGIVLNSGVTAQGQPTTNPNCVDGVDATSGSFCGSGTFETGAGQAPWGLGLAAAVITVGPLVLVYSVIKAAVAVGGAAFGKMSAQIESASQGGGGAIGGIATSGGKGLGKAVLWGANKNKYVKGVKVGLDRRKKNKESRAILKGAETLEENEWLGNLLENKITGGGGKAAADSTRAASVSAVKEMSEQGIKEQQALALHKMEHGRRKNADGSDMQAWEHLRDEYAAELNEGDNANLAKLNALKSLLDQQGDDGQKAINAVLENFMTTAQAGNHKFKEHAQHVSLHDGAMTAKNMAGYMTYYSAGIGATTMGEAFKGMGITDTGDSSGNALLSGTGNTASTRLTPMAMGKEKDMYGSLGAAQLVDQVKWGSGPTAIQSEGAAKWLTQHAATARAAVEARANTRVDKL